jgi:hypothetical protein
MWGVSPLAHIRLMRWPSRIAALELNTVTNEKTNTPPQGRGGGRCGTDAAPAVSPAKKNKRLFVLL